MENDIEVLFEKGENSIVFQIIKQEGIPRNDRFFWEASNGFALETFAYPAAYPDKILLRSISQANDRRRCVLLFESDKKRDDWFVRADQALREFCEGGYRNKKFGYKRIIIYP